MIQFAHFTSHCRNKKRNISSSTGVVGLNNIFLGNTMAKWGEGDPRWIVEERADAKNVNNWHW